MKKFVPKSMILTVKRFLKKHDFELKTFCLVRFRIKLFSSGQIFNQIFFVLSDFASKFFRFVRFLNKSFTTCQTLNQLFYNASDFEKFTKVHHVYFSQRFPTCTMYSYSLQYLRQLDNSTRHRSNNTF